MTENQQPIPLIKCLYNTSTSNNTLCISDKCFNTYAEMYDKEINYDGKRFSIDKKLIYKHHCCLQYSLRITSFL